MARSTADPAAGTVPCRVVVVADELPPAELAAAVEPYRDDHLYVIAPLPHAEWNLAGTNQRYLRFEKESNLHWYLKLWGPFDTILNLRQVSARKHARMLGALFFHLAPGGEYVLPRSSVRKSAPGGDLEAKIAQGVEYLSHGDLEALPPKDREFARALREIRIDRDRVVLRKSNRHFLKLSDRWTNRMLGTRSPETVVRELERVPGGTFASSTTIASYGATRPKSGLDSTVRTPDLHLRNYRGRIGFVSNSLTFTGNEVLPDSFRHHLRSLPTNPRLVDVDKDFCRIEQHVLPREDLAGSYYLLDSENSGHYGHLLTEVVSRLWGWDQAKADDPDLKAIFRIRFPNERDPALERLVFSAFGIDRNDIVWVDHPVYLESMYAATPMFHNAVPHHVHPGIRDVWRRIGAGLPSSSGPTWERVFVSRRDSLGNRRCENREDVEEYFEARGFTVIYPEDYPLAHQAAIFRNARVLAGFGGSAMFTAIFAEQLEDMIVLTHEAYTARNEALIALPLGTRFHYFWNEPNVSHPPDGWSRAAYRSDWTFDFGRHRDRLDALLGRSTRRSRPWRWRGSAGGPDL